MGRLLLAVLMSMTMATAADISGKWTGGFEIMRADGATRNEPGLLIFTQEGNVVTGSGGPNEDKQFPIQNGKIEGDKVTFEMPRGTATIYFTVKIEGNVIQGNAEMRGDTRTETAVVSLKRVSAK